MILACPKDRGQDLSRMMINRMPQPPLLAFAAHKAPHLLHLDGLYLVDDDLHLLSINTLKKSFIDVL